MTQWSPSATPFAYRYAAPPAPPSGRISTSRREMTNILIAAAVLTFDIAYIELRTFVFGGVLAAVAFGATAALTGFVFHELGHKIAAQRRGYWAEFRMSWLGLGLSVFTSVLVGFLLAAPGATMVSGMADRRDWGRTSLAGPVVNLVEGGAFAAAGVALTAGNLLGAFAPYLLLLGFFNGWFATFNLVPLGPLDGRKVLSWSAPVWGVAFTVSAALAAGTFALFFGYIRV